MSDEGAGKKVVNQFLELFGMSAIEGRVVTTAQPAGPVPLCAACYNEAVWDQNEGRWRCPDHSNSSLKLQHVEQEN